MSKKLYGALLPVLAVVAFASMAGTSQAAVHWYVCEKAAGGTFVNNACTASGTTNEFALKQLAFTSAKTKVVTWGELTIHSVALGLTVKCSVIDAGKIWDEVLAAPGKDEITAFTNFECEITEGTCPTPEIIAKIPPVWPTELGENAAKEPIDTIKDIKNVTLFCSGTAQVVLEGELVATLKNPTTSSPLTGTITGELHNAAGTIKATVTGTDFVAGFAHDEGIFVKNP